MDGAYNDANGLNMIKKPSDFSDTTGGTLIGKPCSGDYVTELSIAAASGFEWAFYASANSGGSDSTYITDKWSHSGSSSNLLTGAYWKNYMSSGLFALNNNPKTAATVRDGFRLMELP